MQKPPRKHHYVQAEHIRQFVNDHGLVHVYAKDGTRFTGTPEGVYKQKDLNSYDTPSGIQTGFETWITKVENDCWPTVRHVIEIGSIGAGDIGKVATYLCLSRLRNPTMQRAVVEQRRSVIETTAKLMDRAGKFDHIGPMPFAPEKTVEELFGEGLLEVSVNNSVFLETIVNLLDQLTAILVHGFRWCIVRSTRDRVVVSDHPLTFVHPGMDFGPYGMPFGGEGCEVAFPLSKRLYLVGVWEQEVFDQASEDVVDELNRRQAMFASRHIASCHESRRLSQLAMRFKHYSHQMVTTALNMPDSTYHVSRAGVFRIGNDRSFKGKHPLLTVCKISPLLKKRP